MGLIWAATTICAALFVVGCGGPLVSDVSAAPRNYPTEGVLEQNLAVKPLKNPIQPGDIVPYITWQDQAGRYVSTAELMAGGDAVLVFVPGDGDPATRPVYEYIRRNRDMISRRKGELLIVTPDLMETNAEVSERENLRVAMLNDPSAWGARAFGLVGMNPGSQPPRRVWTVLIGKEGKVLAIEAGLMAPSDLISAMVIRSAAQRELRAFDGVF